MDNAQCEGELLFQSENLSVLFFSGSRTDVVAVTFSPLNTRTSPWAKAFFSSRDVPCICFVSAWDHWWQLPELPGAITIAKQKCDRYMRVMTYGTSMGAYAALRFSKDLGATDVVAFTPQFSIDRQAVPFEKRWQSHAAKIDFSLGSVNAGVSQTASIILAYDPRSPDAQHVALIDAPHARHLRYPYVGHNVIGFVSKAGQLKPLIEDVLRGVSPHAPIPLRLRRNWSPYWAAIAQFAFARQNYDLAVTCLENATAIDPDTHHYAARLARVFEKTKQFEGAARWFATAFRLKPDDLKSLGKATRYGLLATRQLIRQDRLDEALSCATTAAEIASSDISVIALVRRVKALIKRRDHRSRSAKQVERST